MLAVLNYLKVRYLGEKGQGMVEYALILAFVVAVAAVVFAQNTTGGLGAAINGIVTKVTTAVNGTPNKS